MASLDVISVMDALICKYTDSMNIVCQSCFKLLVWTKRSAAINVMPEGGEGPQDEVIIGGDFERPCASHVGNFSKLWTEMLAPGSESLSNVKRRKRPGPNAGSLETSVPPSWKYPEFPEVRTCFPPFPVAIKWRNERKDKSFKIHWNICNRFTSTERREVKREQKRWKRRSLKDLVQGRPTLIVHWVTSSV